MPAAPLLTLPLLAALLGRVLRRGENDVLAFTCSSAGWTSRRSGHLRPSSPNAGPGTPHPGVAAGVFVLTDIFLARQASWGHVVRDADGATRMTEA